MVEEKNVSTKATQSGSLVKQPTTRMRCH